MPWRTSPTRCVLWSLRRGGPHTTGSSRSSPVCILLCCSSTSCHVAVSLLALLLFLFLPCCCSCSCPVAVPGLVLLLFQVLSCCYCSPSSGAVSVLALLLFYFLPCCCFTSCPVVVPVLALLLLQSLAWCCLSSCLSCRCANSVF